MSAATVIAAQPSVPCWRCKKSHSNEMAFLMACVKCERTWHHVCHIPPISEAEILGRIDADERGKREAGLATWQCRMCTKKARIEPTPGLTPSSRPQPPVMPAGPSQTGSIQLPNVSHVASMNSTGAAVGTPIFATTSSHTSVSQSQAVINIDDDDDGDDDDIIVIDNNPKQNNLNKRPAKPAAEIQPAAEGPARATAVNLSSQQSMNMPLPQANAAQIDDPGIRQIAPLRRTAQKRSTGNQFIITPLPRAQEHVIKDPGPSTQPSRVVPSSASSNPSNLRHTLSRPTNAPTASQPLQATIPVRTEPPPPPPATIISSADIRELISKMRSQGRLEPPPTVDYIHTRPHETVDDLPRKQPHASRRGATVFRDHRPSRSHTRDIDHVELTTRNDLDDDAMDVDSDPGPRGDPASLSLSDSDREAEPAREPEDPHNIDDLYGDIAPRFRSKPPQRRATTVVRLPRTPLTDRDRWPPRNDLLERLEIQKRVVPKGVAGGATESTAENDEGEGGATRGNAAQGHRKAEPRRLKGKTLKKKQEKGLHLFLGDLINRAGAG